jgi:hypothetical protein
MTHAATCRAAQGDEFFLVHGSNISRTRSALHNFTVECHFQQGCPDLYNLGVIKKDPVSSAKPSPNKIYWDCGNEDLLDRELLVLP